MEHPKHIITAASLIINKDDQILLVKTPWRGWELPGGQVEEGEDIITAVAREALEEAGAVINVGKLAAICSSVNEPVKVTFDFLAEYESGEVKPAMEVTAAQWFSKDEALQQVTNEPMLFRLKRLLEYDGKVRYSVYSKDPFNVISEHIVN